MRLKEDAAKKEEEESRDLEQRTMSLAQWQKKLGEVVPLSMVPDVLNTHPGYVAMAIREGRLPVHTFHAQNGKKVPCRAREYPQRTGEVKPRTQESLGNLAVLWPDQSPALDLDSPGRHESCDHSGMIQVR